jgi:hypothetical protein
MTSTAVVCARTHTGVESTKLRREPSDSSDDSIWLDSEAAVANGDLVQMLEQAPAPSAAELEPESGAHFSIPFPFWTTNHLPRQARDEHEVSWLEKEAHVPQRPPPPPPPPPPPASSCWSAQTTARKATCGTNECTTQSHRVAYCLCLQMEAFAKTR